MVHVTQRDLGDEERHANNGRMSLKCNSRGITSLSDDVFEESLRRIDLSKNELESIPSGMSVCLNLTWLNLSGNALTDCKPLESLRNLEVLNLSKNNLYGKIGMGKFTKLKALVLNGNEIETLGGLEKLTQLETLIISQNKISSFGGWIAGATSLQKLSASNNPIEWDIGSNSGLSSLTRMKELRLNHTGMTRVPEALARMKRLRILELGSNSLETFDDIDVLSSIRSMWQLNLKGNPVASMSGYGDRITALLPQIDVLDTKRLRSKNKHQMHQSVGNMSSDIPSLSAEERTKKKKEKEEEDASKRTHTRDEMEDVENKEEEEALEPEDFLVTTRKKQETPPQKGSPPKETRTRTTTKTQHNIQEEKKKKKKTPASQEALKKALQAKETSLSTWE